MLRAAFGWPTGRPGSGRLFAAAAGRRRRAGVAVRPRRRAERRGELAQEADVGVEGVARRPGHGQPQRRLARLVQRHRRPAIS